MESLAWAYTVDLHSRHVCIFQFSTGTALTRLECCMAGVMADVDDTLDCACLFVCSIVDLLFVDVEYTKRI